MAKIKLDPHLYDRVKKISEQAGYASAEEFILHIIERELDALEPGEDEDDAKVIERLKGLGYIE